MATAWVFPLVVVAVTSMTSCHGQNVDATRTPGTSGSDVVNAVVDVIKASCIYSEDRQLLRRLAFVETQDGTDPDTYKAGYDGGIWKVDEDMFNVTTSCKPVIRRYCDLIHTNFNIDWTQTKWFDLRKPLYSALAAVLYLTQRTNNASVPAGLDEQEELWRHYYHFGQAHTKNFSSLAVSLRWECEDEMDLAFIVDSSGSIDDSDFQLSLDFLASVVQHMHVPNVVRVATLIFENLSHVQFHFNPTWTKSKVLKEIQGILRSTGGTNTAGALDMARTDLFNVTNNARPQKSVKRVAVLLTDGQSDSLKLTSEAAHRLRQVGVTVFAIGIGGYDIGELQAIASTPPCSHVFTLKMFAHISSIISEIQRSTCRAHTTMTHGVGIVSKQNTTTISTTRPNTNETLVVTVHCGVVDIYVSDSNPNPNPAVYTAKFTASDGKPAYLTSLSSDNGGQLYMTVVASPGSDLGHVVNCSDFKFNVSVEKNNYKVQCCSGDDCRDCTDDELRKDKHIKDVVCDNKHKEEFPNPCTQKELQQGHLIFPHPFDTSSFIRCDYQGKAYVTLCPDRATFNPTTLTCGFEASGDKDTILPPDYPNPCTPSHIEAGDYYFPYKPDARKYIHCDNWGGAWLQNCPHEDVWDQSQTTCVYDNHGPGFDPHFTSTPKPPTATPRNPCTPANLAKGLLFHPYPCDHTRFLHCDIGGHYWVQSCPAHLFYHPDAHTCVPFDPHLHGESC